MPWTALHSALGEQNPALTFALIERACDLGIEEATSLDWKRDLPLTVAGGDGRARQQAELAKDVAAMANSGGGMIVYGVIERAGPASSAAASVSAVGAIDEVVLQQIRQVAGNLIYPPVVGLELYPLAPADDPDAGVLALLVPDSAQGPHLVHPANPKTLEYFMAPYRHGPHTERMMEHQLAIAYREREQRARTRRQELSDTWDDAVSASTSGQVWVVATAIPESPHPRPRELTIEQANEVFEQACFPGRSGTISGLGLTQSAPTARGLQRFKRSMTRTVHVDGRQPRLMARVELYGNGSVVIAASRGSAFSGGTATGDGHEVAVSDVEQVGIDLLRLIGPAQQIRGVRATYLARVGLSKHTEIFRRGDSMLMGNFLPFDESHRVPNYRPVDGPIIGTEDKRTLVDSTFDLTRDAVNQAGCEVWHDPAAFYG